MNNNYTFIFSINETLKSTNEDIIVTITPPENILKYEYTIIKNEEIKDSNVVVENKQINIALDESGIYRIEVKLYDTNLNQYSISSGMYKIDKEKPVIMVESYSLEMPIGSNLIVNEGISVYDEMDGNLIDKVTSNYDSIDFTTTGLKQLVYTVSDEAGNTSTATVNINVVPNNTKQILFFESAIIFLLIVICLLFIKYLKSIKLEKRIAKYTIEPLNDNSLSLFDKFFLQYHKLVSKVGSLLGKSVFIEKYSKRYEKYIGIVDKTYNKAIDLVASKLFIGIMFLGIAIFSRTIQSDVLSLYEIIIPITVGFFLPDLIYFSKYKVYRLRIENDLLQAIIIMNNAFKSGRSITQAIELVSVQLDGPMAEEFKKMSLELSFGLSIEDVFKRFSKRVELTEVTYLTASLSILNKTGGNIIKVFSSIERTLFSQKKLKLELASLTGSSKIIVYILFVVPILFVVFISIIDPTYFLPLITTPIGLIITTIVLVVYVIYIVVVRKIMKVRM